jgi:hypothetical protein
MYKYILTALYLLVVAFLIYTAWEHTEFCIITAIFGLVGAWFLWQQENDIENKPLDR